MEQSKDTDRASLREEVTDRIIQQIATLPPMPATALELRTAVKDPHVDFPRLVPLIEKDPGLCADLLRFANSAAYGVGHPVVTVSEAVRYFGLENLVEYILVSYSNRLIRQSFQKLQHLKDYFTHSEQVSVACHYIAQQAQLSPHEQEVCKIAGLLHNIGRLVILLATQEWGGALLGTPWDKRQALISMEEEKYGLNHCEVGARLCQKWKFPDALLVGIRYHHKPLRNGQVISLAAFVYLGEMLVIDNLPLDIITHDFTPPILKQLNLTQEKLCQARNDFIAIRSNKA